MTKYRVHFNDDSYEHWDLVSLIENPGWVTCWHLDPVGVRIDTPVVNYPRDRIRSVLKYDNGA